MIVSTRFVLNLIGRFSLRNPNATVDRATLFGSANDREVKRLQSVVAQINALEPELEKLSDEELRGRTSEFQQKYKNGLDLDDLLPEAFATVREAAKRTSVNDITMCSSWADWYFTKVRFQKCVRAKEKR